MSRTRIDYRIVSDVRDWMREAGLADLAFKLRLKYDGGGHLWESDSDWPAAEPPASRPAGKFLSNLGQRIVDYLRGRGLEYTSAKVIAEELGESNTQRFQGLLTDLVEREVLDSLTSGGYRLMPANGPNTPARPAAHT